jgi:amino acid permease
MSPKAYFRPGKTASVMGILVGCLMLIFGLVFFWLVREDGSVIGQIFIPLWMLVVILIIGYNIYNLKSSGASRAALGEMEIDAPGPAASIEEKLRSLERMKKDRLITEAEYRQKRKEIMEQKW